MPDKRTPVKVGLTAEENAHISRQAQALGMDRSTLMRLRALGDPTVAGKGSGGSAAHFTLRQYQNAVAAASRAARGCAPRPVLEAIAAAVLCSIHEETSPRANEPGDTNPAQTVG